MIYGSVQNLWNNIKKDWASGKRLFPIIEIVIVLSIVTSSILAIINVYKDVFSDEKDKPYSSTQTVYLNTGHTPFSYVDINGRGWLVPLPVETLMEAKRFGEVIKGSQNEIYMGRVVIVALDPSMRYVEIESGISMGTAYKPENLYTFYLPDGNDIKDGTLREHIIKIGHEKYKVTLLFIDTRDKKDLPKYAYTFRVEKL